MSEKSYTVRLAPSYDGEELGLLIGESELDIKAVDISFALEYVADALKTASFGGGNAVLPELLTIEIRCDE